jgi:hypothetical protein
MPRPARPVLAVLALLVAITAARPASAAADEAPGYRPPVDAPVVDPFRPPTSPFGPGNRGLLYDTAPGTPVSAAADGTVAFAGSVAGSRHVTVLHDDGLRTTYSFLDEVSVVAGQRVTQGDLVGTTAGQLHLGARSGDAYLDPASLFVAGSAQVHLVPFDEPLAAGAEGERGAIRQLLGGAGRLALGAGEALADHVLEGTGATAAWLRDEGPQLARTAGHYLQRGMPGIAQLTMGLDLLAAWSRARAASSRPCTPDGAAVEPPGERRVALLVAGLGSTSDSAAIDDVDTAALGYDDGDVLRFSYVGGRIPDPTDGFAHLDANPYDAGDTQGDLRAAGARLADLLDDVVAGSPLTIDLYAHSQGGVVARLALIELERRHGRAWLARLGVVATLGTPHGGADAATAVHAVGTTGVGSSVLDVGGLALGLDDDAPGAAQLAETSDVVAELAATPVPPNVDAVSIAARGDLVVPVPRAVAGGMVEVVVPLTGLSAHDALPGSTEAARELALALAGRPPGCQTFREALTSEAVGHAITAAEDAIGTLAWVAAGWRGPPLGG